MIFYIYILISLKDSHLYIGFTKDLKKRIITHNIGGNVSTKNRGPFKLIYYEAYISEKDARVREKFLKSGRGHEIIYKHLKETLLSLKQGR